MYNIPRHRSDLAEQQKLDSYIGTYFIRGTRFVRCVYCVKFLKRVAAAVDRDR